MGGWLGYVISLILYSAFLYKIKTNPPEVFPFNKNKIQVAFVRFERSDDNSDGVPRNLSFESHSDLGNQSLRLLLFLHQSQLMARPLPRHLLHRPATQTQIILLSSLLLFQIDWQTYLYLVGIVVLAFVSGYYQIHQKNKKTPDHNTHDDNYHRIPKK